MPRTKHKPGSPEAIEAAAERRRNRLENALYATYLGREESAIRTSFSVPSIDKAKARGELPFYKRGGRILFKAVDLDAWVEKHRIDPTTSTSNCRRPRANGRFAKEGAMA